MMGRVIAAFVLLLGFYSLYTKKENRGVVAELCLVFLVSLSLLPKAVPQAFAVFVLSAAIILASYRAKRQKRVSSSTPTEKYIWPKMFFRLSGALFFLTVVQIARSGSTSFEVDPISQHEVYNLITCLFLAAMYFRRKANWKH